MAITRKGRKLTPREQSAEVRKLAGWDTKTYQKEYDKLRNRARAYERATGREKGSINVADLLARDVRRRWAAQYYGEKYKPTELYYAVSSAPSISSGKQVSKQAMRRINVQELRSVSNQFKGVIQNSKYANQIRAEAEDLSRQGKLTASAYREIAEKYARALQEERENAQRLNASISDPYHKIYFNST